MELVFSVIIDGDDAATNVHLGADFTVAQISQVSTAAVKAKLGVFKLDKISDSILTVYFAVRHG